MAFDWNRELRETALWMMKLQDTPGWEGYARTRYAEILEDPECKTALPAMVAELRKEAGNADRS